MPLNHPTIREETEGRTYESIHPERNHLQRDNDSVKTASVEGDTARNSHQYNEKDYTNEHHVNIQRAERDFAELSKELSRSSNQQRRLSRVQSSKSAKGKVVTDEEKGVQSDTSSDEPFDLEATLRGSKDEEEAAGIKSKHIGVVWDNLTVSGIGA